jgi:glycosyltransferase involved in cell wall biosynthesis
MPLVGRKVRFIPIGAAPVRFTDRSDAWNTVRSLTKTPPDEGLRIVTIAELTPNKGLRYGIDAVAKLVGKGIPCTYVIISDGEEFGRLTQHAMESVAHGRVCFTGFVPEARRLLKAFDLFLLPSLKEGMPYVLLEAAEAGLPIVATDAVDPSFADMYSAIAIVPSANADALCDAIVAMRGKNGRLTGHASLESVIETTISLYEPRPSV